MLKIYEYYQGWCGAVIVVASDQEQAEQLVKDAAAYVDGDRFIPSNLKEYEIVAGLTVNVFGDQ